MAISLITSYGTANADDFDYLSSVDNLADGQSFVNPSSIALYSTKFYLSKTGSPTGNIVSKIYAVAGTSGTNAVPTGSALATSGVIDIATLTGSSQLVEFVYTGVNAITLGTSTAYAATVEYSGGNGSNQLRVAADLSSPSYAGNFSAKLSGGTWIGDASADFIFFVYGGSPTATTAHTSNSNLRKAIMKLFTTNSNLRKVITKTFSTNALMGVRHVLTSTTNSYLKKRRTIIHTVSSFIKKVYYKTHSTGSYLRKRGQKDKPIIRDAVQDDKPSFK